MTVRKNARHATERWLWLVAAVAVATLLVATVALAVHQLNFQLDGDTSTTDIAPITGVTRTVDWDSLYTATGAKVASPPAGFAPGDLSKDFRTKANGEFDTSDGSTYTGGSKDTLDISTGWRCVGANNVTNKGDITNAYAAQYTVPAGSAEAGDKILYFGMEKYVPQGTNNIGVWFLQDQNVGCAENGTGNGNAFTGNHVTGDLLIVSAFSNGGAVSTILAYSWDSTLNGGAGGLVLQTPTAGVDCRATSATPFDDICGAANQASIAIKWPHASSADGSHGQAGSADIPAATFFEGGIDISNFPAFAGKCFTKYLFDTRSAVSTTASIYDYTIGTLGSCESTTVTTPQKGDGSAIPGTPKSMPITTAGSVTVRDSALVTVSGVSTFNGTVAFSLCGPLAADSTTNCQTGGASIGSVPITTSGTVNSAVTTLTSAGRYCWRAVFSGDAAAGVPGSSDPSNATNLSECFIVTPMTPTISTSATATVALGGALDDTATLTGTANQPGSGGLGNGTINPTSPGGAAGGTITFSLYGPSATAVCTTAIATSVVNVSGDSSASNLYKASQGTITGSLSPSQVGTYYWIAVYSGNLPNTNGVSGSCGNTGETSTVTDQTAVLTDQSWLPNDSAKISSTGGSALDGSVVFTLYNNGTCDPGTANANVLYTSASIGVSGSSPQIRSTSNTTVKVAATATVSWKVVYTSNPTGVSGSTSSCESTALTINNNPGFSPLPSPLP